MTEHYILDNDGNPVPEYDLIKFGHWFQTADRRVANDSIGDVRISTVFLGIDHNFSGSGPPILFETMIFGGPHDDYCERYSNRIAALAGHDQAIALVHDRTSCEGSS